MPRSALVLFVLVAACGSSARSTTPHAEAPLSRLRFNRLAMRLDLPIFWAGDADGDGEPDPDEVRSLLFHTRRACARGSRGVLTADLGARELLPGGAPALHHRREADRALPLRAVGDD